MESISIGALPSTPSTIQAPIKLITPEKMKQCCSRVPETVSSPARRVLEFSDRSDTSSPLSEWGVAPYVSAHSAADQPHIQIAIDQIQHVSFDEFIRALGRSLSAVYDHLEPNGRTLGSDCITLIEDGKSNLWVAALAKKFFAFDPERCLDLGLNNAESFRSMLEVNQRDLAIVREKFRGKSVVLFDDASYSGKQMSQHLFHTLKSIHEFGLPAREVIVVVPYMTAVAKTEIEQVRHKFSLESFIAPSENLKMLSALPATTFQVLTNLWYQGKSEEASKIALAMFEHKVPNYQSFPAAIARGSVYQIIGAKSQSMPQSFRVLEDADRSPPYKADRAIRDSVSP